jgi:hypothetical protein
MVDKMIPIFRYLPLLLASVALPSSIFAHQLDEYLQGTIVTIEPGEIRLEINLTPGVAVAERVMALIDRNHDGVISTNEARDYAELLKSDLSVRIDQRNLELNVAAFNFPEPSELRTGWGIIQMEFSVQPGSLAAGPHMLTFENRHLPAVSVYLFNAAQPRSAEIQIARQTRNKTQSAGEIAFDFKSPPNPSRSVVFVALPVVLLATLVTGAWIRRR